MNDEHKKPPILKITREPLFQDMGKIGDSSDDIKERVFSKEEIVEKLHQRLRSAFGFSGINIYLLDPTTRHVNLTYPESGAWMIPEKEIDWLIKRAKEGSIDQKRDSIDYLYIPDRSQILQTDKDQIKKDISEYEYECKDGLYLVLISEDDVIMGIVFINNWADKMAICPLDKVTELTNALRETVSEYVVALDNLFIHYKIESLLSDKRALKQRIQKDEEDLRRRLLELTVLYDTSNSLGYSLDYQPIVRLVMDALYKVLNFDVCAVFLIDFIEEGEITVRVNKPLEPSFIKSVQSNIISASMPFIKRVFDQEKVKLTVEKEYSADHSEFATDHMKSFANVPLVFKEEVIGMLNVCSTSKNVFTRNEMTFLHTMANQLSSHLGRIKIVKSIEKSKISSLIKSMSEGVVMLDHHRKLDFINPAALDMLELGPIESVQTEHVLQKFEEMTILRLIDQLRESGQMRISRDLFLGDRAISVNVSDVIDIDQKKVGTVFVFRDFSELQKVNRINSQRLEVISKVSLIIKSISDLDNLLSVLMDFILNIAHAEMGAIQLKQGKHFHTLVHSNFPDKIREEYRFNSGETITERVIQTKDILFISDYESDESVNQKVKIALESFVCVPILVKNNLIGTISIARKKEEPSPKLTQDDINTLSTITSLSGTAILNALLYQDTIKKQKLDQELKVANEIQTRLLPGALPKIDYAEFGAISVPAHEIGGDYYDFFNLNNGQVGIVLADIVGKGIPAALFMAMLKSIVHTHLKEESSPKEAMNKLNSILYKDPVINKFIPVFYAIYDPSTLTISYSNAGHEPALHYSDDQFNLLDSSGFPLGAYPDSDFEEKKVQLKDKDIVLFFTDGIIEARNRSGINFGLSRIKSGIKEGLHLSGAKLPSHLFDSVKAFSQSAPQHDDLTLVCLKVSYDTQASDNTDQPLDSIRITVKSKKSEIRKIRQEVERISKKMGFSDSDIFNLKLAINEAQANVIEHAYLGREDGEILFQFLVYPDRLDIIIKDFGKGIGQKTTKGEDHLDELEGSGLGVFLIKSVMDKVKYIKTNKIGTELLLTKYLRSTEEKA